MPADGYSLIEVLISLFVLGIGVMACVWMQLAGLRMTREAGYRTEAARLAAEMIETMDDSGYRPGVAYLTNADIVDIDGNAEVPTPETLCYSAICSPQQMREAEFHDWIRRVRHVLPQARIRICLDHSTGEGDARHATWNCSAGDQEPGLPTIKIGWRSVDVATGGKHNVPIDGGPGMIFVLPGRAP